MNQYLIAFIGVVVVLVLRLYFSYSRYNKAKSRYATPKELAADLLTAKDENIKFFLETMSEEKELNSILMKCITEIKEEWEKINQGQSRDCSRICDRFRQTAILLELMVLQHEKEMYGLTKAQLDSKMKLVEKTLMEQRLSLEEIKDNIRKKNLFTSRECSTIERYCMDIFNFFQKNK